MRLLLCDRSDRSALWAFHALRAHGLALELVSTSVLMCALTWEHRLNSESTALRIGLADGRTIDSNDLDGVLNRVVALPDELPQAARNDRDYAFQELQAFWLSWLNGLPCPVLNRPSSRGLSGPWIDETEWRTLAARAGLVTLPYHSGTTNGNPGMTHQRLIITGELIGPAPDALKAGCRRLAEVTDASILGVEFAANGGWAFVRATPHPDLTIGGTRGIELLAAAISGR
jgi:hypothetical protein